MKEIAKEYELKQVYLFGSQAEGRASKDSDVDLLLVSPKFRKVHPLDRSPKLYLRWSLQYPVDFICYTPEEFSRSRKQPSIVREAVERGVEIPVS